MLIGLIYGILFGFPVGFITAYRVDKWLCMRALANKEMYDKLDEKIKEAEKFLIEYKDKFPDYYFE